VSYHVGASRFVRGISAEHRFDALIAAPLPTLFDRRALAVSSIREVRGQRVLLDSDLAAIYGVSTSALNQAIKRNRLRFPADFMFQLTSEESAALKSQNAASSGKSTDGETLAMISSQIVTGSSGSDPMRSQIVIASKRNVRHLPFAFTEHGALQAANVLKSDRAAAMSVFVIRAFVQMRESLAANVAVLQQLAAMDRKLLEHDEALVILWNKLKPLLVPPPPVPKRRIGFKP